MVGDSDVGKTFLCSQNQLPERPAHTIGVEYFAKTVPIKPTGFAGLRLWDSSGQKQYANMIKTHCRRVVGALIVFDLTQEVTFQRVPLWVQVIREGSSNAVLMLVGNKRDLVQENPSLRAVTFENA